MQAVIKLISAGWPQHRSQVPVAAREYTVAKAELSEHDGLVIKERRIVVLRVMRKEILEKIHEGHQLFNNSKVYRGSTGVSVVARNFSRCKEHSAVMSDMP